MPVTVTAVSSVERVSGNHPATVKLFGSIVSPTRLDLLRRRQRLWGEALPNG